jgi:hypothetical protein
MTQTQASSITPDQWKVLLELCGVLRLSAKKFAASYGIEQGRDVAVADLPGILKKLLEKPEEWQK